MPDLPPAPEVLPFVAPCRSLATGAPLRWLRLGIADLRAAPRASLTYGLGIALLSLAVSYIGWRYGSGWMLIVLLSSFVFVAPVLAIGLYAISAQLGRGDALKHERGAPHGRQQYQFERGQPGAVGWLTLGCGGDAEGSHGGEFGCLSARYFPLTTGADKRILWRPDTSEI